MTKINSGLFLKIDRNYNSLLFQGEGEGTTGEGAFGGCLEGQAVPHLLPEGLPRAGSRVLRRHFPQDMRQGGATV